MAVRNTFDRVAAEYDAVKQRILPGYSEMRAALDRWRAADAGVPLRALELGCGTGQWAAAFLDRHPRAELVAVEFWADIVDSGSAELETLFRDSWAAFMRANDLDDASVEAVLLDHDQNDLPETIEAQLGYLREAGFADTTVVWRREPFAVLYGRRPS